MSLLFLLGAGTPASADAITDWNEKASAFVMKHRMLPPQAERIIACMHVAMFDAVNALDRRYQPYRHFDLRTEGRFKGSGCGRRQPVASWRSCSRLTARNYAPPCRVIWRAIPDGPAKSAGIQVGEDVAARTIMDRQGDGADAPDAYRPKTKPGVYVPTPITASSMWPKVKPFAMTSPSQFRPQPPVALTSAEWAG